MVRRLLAKEDYPAPWERRSYGKTTADRIFGGRNIQAGAPLPLRRLKSPAEAQELPHFFNYNLWNSHKHNEMQ